MTIILLRHNKKTAYYDSKLIPCISEEMLACARGGTLITFRGLDSGKPDRIINNFHACSRLLGINDDYVVALGLESDSPLGPLVLWDIAHSIPIGGTLLVVDEGIASGYLERDYYRMGLCVQSRDESGVLFSKVAPLPAEREKGLDRWSFCIPVGPEDATILNVAIRRILEINVPEKEILLCGRPGSNFKYWDKVRIVGEDISAPPVQISRKKNRLVEEARFENLCILHDRVFLPEDFFSAVQKFGDCYPITGFQSLYFDDLWNSVPRRYSDGGRALSRVSGGPLGVARPGNLELSEFSPSVLAELEGVGFIYSNPLRYEKDQYYLTGSLYISKRSVWLMCPQNDSIAWAEFEDIEHAGRASAAGIPNRINPYAFTQSIINRPILSAGGRVTYEDSEGKIRQSARLMQASFVPLKPLIKLGAEEAYCRLDKFAQRYLIGGSALLARKSEPNAAAWLASAGQVIGGAGFPLQEAAVRQFINDYERWVLCDQLPYGRKEYFVRQFMCNSARAKIDLFEQSVELINFVAQRPRGNWFYKSLLDYLPVRSMMLLLGSLLSALYLWKRSGREVFVLGGVLWCYRAILKSTPLRYYAEREL